MNDLQKSLIEMVEDMFNLSEDKANGIVKQYQKSKDNIKDIVARLYMEHGDNGKIEPHEAKKHKRMEKLFEQVKEEASNLAENEVVILGSILATVYATSYYKSAYKMEKGLQLGINFKIQRKEFIDEVVNRNWSGVPFSERIWSNQDALVKSLRTQLMQGVEEGETIDQMARSIDKEFDSKLYQSQRLMRTEAARVITDAQENIYNDSKIIKYVEWSATLESNTCRECAKLDGQRFRLDNTTKPKIPKHPNCRCVYIPVPYEEYRPSRRKDNETKEINEYQSYEEWYEAKVNK